MGASYGNLGKKHSEEAKEKMRKSAIGKHDKERNQFFGKTHTKETREKISKASKGKKMSFQRKKELSVIVKKYWENKGVENCHWYKGGITNTKYPEDWTSILRESIRERDSHICQECGVHQDETNRRLHVHHIDYDKENCNPNNLISLCISCHIQTNSNREHWTEYFNNFIK